jgi:hypothetical protein
MPELVLSLFPGIGLLDRAFEEAGFCVVRGPDLLWGGDVRVFHPPVRDSPLTVAGKIKVLGNGVPMAMGRAIALAVKRARGLPILAADDEASHAHEAQPRPA